MPVSRARRAPKGRKPKRPRAPRSSTPAFVGRDPSPVLDHYPPKDPSLAPRAPPPIVLTTPPSVPGTAATSSPRTDASLPAPTAPPPTTTTPLITLDRPFDVDEFASLLGETSIRVTVPRDALPEVLRRVNEFMGFGIYVYSISVRPAPAELLKSFVVELQRVDFSAEKQAWVPFVEQGTSPPRS